MGTMLWILTNIAVIAAVCLCVKNRKNLGKISVVVRIVLALLLSGVLVWYFTPFQRELPENRQIKVRLYNTDGVLIEEPEKVEAIAEILSQLEFKRQWSDEANTSYSLDDSLTLQLFETGSRSPCMEFLLVKADGYGRSSLFTSENGKMYHILDASDVMQEILEIIG